MHIRRALVPLLLAATAALTACGGDDSSADTGTDDPTPTTSQSVDESEAADPGESEGSGDSAGPVKACDVLSPDDVAAAVGGEVGEGVPSSGPSMTGGSYTTCVWTSTDPELDFGTATVTIYDDAAAADSARQPDDPDLEGLGDKAYTGSFASVWVYTAGRSFFAQWYTLSAIGDENLPQSKALAQAVVDAL